MNLSQIGRVCTATAVIASSVLLGLPSNASAAPVANSIAGTVRNDANNTLGGIRVEAREGGPYGSYAGSATTQPDGTYLLTGVPAGDVYLYFQDGNTPAEYVTEWYGGTYNSEHAVPIARATDGSATGIDATLSPGVTVSGTVTGPSGDPIHHVNVSVDPESRDGAHGWGQTDEFGNYTTSPVLPGDKYRVRFNAQDETLALQYWNGKPTWNSADAFAISESEPVGPKDAQLSVGAQVTGNVTQPGGAPAPNICVSAAYDLDGGYDGVAWAETDSAGNYELKQLPVGTYRIEFDDCNDTGPFLEQWYDGSGSRDGAKTINLIAGTITNAIDAQMQPGASIRGTVKNTGGTPLEDICVQASTDGFTGGSDRTNSDGTYSIDLAYDGKYKVQFVDCGDMGDDDEPPMPGGTYLAQWWGGGLEPATAKGIDVAIGANINGIDARLATADGTGTVTGHVTNMSGQALKACVVLYLPFEQPRFEKTDVNGKYSFTGVPTGTWTIAFLGCRDGGGASDVSLAIPDAGGTGVFFNAMWFDGKPLQMNSEDPDPIAQGATLVTIRPDEAFTADQCFGCGAVKVKPPVIGEDFILVDFDTTGLSEGDGKQAMARAGLTYQVACGSKTGISTSASQDSYPVKVSGFTPGAPYVCSAHILSNGVQVADSTTFAVTVGTAASPTPADPGGQPGDSPATPTQPSNDSGDTTTPTAQPVSYNTSGAAPAKLAYTGGNITAAMALAAFMILMGIGAIATSMRMNSDPRIRTSRSR